MQIGTEVLDVLAAADIKGKELRIVEKLDRNLYTKVNKVLEALGGKWTKKVQAHIFDGDAQERIDLAVTSGTIETHQDMGFFVTPDPLALRLVEMVDIQGGSIGLEPSAGTGAIADFIIGKGATCVMIERDPNRRTALINKRRMVYDWHYPSNHGGYTAQIVEDCDDFLDFRSDVQFDFTVMNPPFLRVGKGDHLDHVRHAFSLMRKGGKLASILPSSIEFRRDRRYKEFREWVEDKGEVIKLPPNSFKSSGTGVNTVAIRLEKP